MRVAAFAFLAGVAAFVVAVTGYVVNIIELFHKDNTVVQTAVEVVGVFAPPIGAIHGLGHLFGVW